MRLFAGKNFERRESRRHGSNLKHFDIQNKFA